MKLLATLAACAAAAAPSAKELDIFEGVLTGFFQGGALAGRACFRHAHLFERGVTLAVGLIEKQDKQDVHVGLGVLATLIAQVTPDALRECHVPTPRVQAIERALSLMAHPRSFELDKGKNVVVDGVDIFRQINAALDSYHRQAWSKFGESLGEALLQVLSGNKEVSFAALSTKEVNLVEGFLEGFFTGDSPVATTCISGAEEMDKDVEEAVKLFETQLPANVLKAVSLLAHAFKQTAPATVAACGVAKTRIVELEHALHLMIHPRFFAFHVGKDLLVNGVDILKEVVKTATSYKAGQFATCGHAVGVAAFEILTGSKSDDLFHAFQEVRSRTYESDEAHNVARGHFTDNVERVKVLSLIDDSAQYSAFGPLGDMSEEAFQTRNALQADQFEGGVVAEELDTSNLPTGFDWRTKGAVNIVKNQGRCGSCWSFATVVNIEGNNFVNTGKLHSLSEQQLVDCDKVDQGCQGGLPSNAYVMMIKNKMGLEAEADYPYHARNEKCSGSPSKEVVFIKNWASISKDEEQIAAALMKYGPLATGINATMMQFYFAGVANPWNMFCNPKKLDHGVAIVGFGEDAGKKYWVIRNSWGPGWGEQGYYRIIRGVGKCGLNTMVTSAEVNGSAAEIAM